MPPKKELANTLIMCQIAIELQVQPVTDNWKDIFNISAVFSGTILTSGTIRDMKGDTGRRCLSFVGIIVHQRCNSDLSRRSDGLADRIRQSC